jgi:hypothetical protein
MIAAPKPSHAHRRIAESLEEGAGGDRERLGGEGGEALLASPSSAVREIVLFYRNDLRDLGADFRHYMADFTRALGQA